MQDIQQQVTALIFVAENAITVEEIRESLAKFHPKEEFSEERVFTLIEAIKLQYMSPDFPFELVELGGGLQFMTKPAYHKLVSVYVNQKYKRRLSKAAMETLSIIAYRQPVTKAEMEQIRGVNCDHGVQKLLEKELIKISGRSDGPGRPLLYSVGEIFMDYFGINSIEDLPKLKDIEPPANEIGGEGGDYFEEGASVQGAVVNGEFVAVNGAPKAEKPLVELKAENTEAQAGEELEESSENIDGDTPEDQLEGEAKLEENEPIKEDEAEADTDEAEAENAEEEEATEEEEELKNIEEEVNQASRSNGAWKKRDEEEEELDPWMREKTSDDEIQRIKNKALEHIGGLETDETE